MTGSFDLFFRYCCYSMYFLRLAFFRTEKKVEATLVNGIYATWVEATFKPLYYYQAAITLPLKPKLEHIIFFLFD